MTEPHLTFQENLAAYALGMLEAGEARALEDHLQSCDECQAELADYERINAGLLSAMLPRQPRAALKRALQKRLETGARASRWPFRWSLGQVALAVALVLLLALNTYSIFQTYTLKQEQAELSSQYYAEQTAIAMLAYPSTHSIGFDQKNISGSLLIDKKRNLLALFVWHLPPPPTGEAYQIWLIDPQGDRTSGGILMSEPNQPFVATVIASSQPLGNYIGIGITLEPQGGSSRPTGPNVLHVDF